MRLLRWGRVGFAFSESGLSLQHLKRFLTILVLLTYFTVTSGFAVSLHYCMDELSGMELGTETADTCPKCGMDAETAPGGCCRDEVKLVQLKGDPAAVPSAFSPLHGPEAAMLPLPASYAPEVFLPALQAGPEPVRPPPMADAGARYIALCTFRL